MMLPSATLVRSSGPLRDDAATVGNARKERNAVPAQDTRPPAPPAGDDLGPFDTTIDEVWTDVDGLLRQYRTHDPVHWSEVEAAWVLTRHADAVAVLRDDRTFVTDGRDATGRAGELVRDLAAQSPLPYDSVLSAANRDDHARLRRGATAAFSPDSVEALRSPIRTLARELLDAATGDEVDAVAGFARPLALGVTLHLLGVDMAEAARVGDLAELVMGATQRAEREAPPRDPQTARAELGELLDTLEVPDDSLIAALRAERAAGRFSDDDLVAMVVFIATVGQAPTSFVVANALLACLRNPDQLQALRADPALLANVMDESARFDPPLRVLRRFAAADTEFGGRQITAGDQIQLIIPAANRDPAAFTEPNRFDLTRGDRTHLSFGWASHRCLGAPVARVIAEESVAMLLEEFPDLAASGRLEVLTGEAAGPTSLGIVGRAGTRPAILEAARATAMEHRSVLPVPPKHACPCGSGRQYRRCHASR